VTAIIIYFAIGLNDNTPYKFLIFLLTMEICFF